MQNAKTENSISESKEIDEEDDDENEDMQRHVEFNIAEDASNEDGCDGNKPNKLQRRDTPHHLKNKRINTAIDKDKAAAIIAQVIMCYLLNTKNIISICNIIVNLFNNTNN